MTGLVNVLFVNVSIPVRVANVPVVGNVTPVAPVIVNVNAKPPTVVILDDAASVIPGTVGGVFNFAPVILSEVAQV